MTKALHWSLLLLAFAALCGCATNKTHTTTTPNPPGRTLIWNANLELEVKEISQATQQATSIVEFQGGYVEKQESNENSARTQMTLRVPSPCFKETLASLGTLGKTKSQRITGEDVAEKAEDLEAKLKQKIALRNRLKDLREKASNVNDTLVFEQRLTELETEIASIQTQLKSTKGKVCYATIELSLERAPILGPVGAVFSGIGWVFQKLFFIRQ